MKHKRLGWAIATDLLTAIALCVGAGRAGAQGFTGSSGGGMSGSSGGGSSGSSGGGFSGSSSGSGFTGSSSGSGFTGSSSGSGFTGSSTTTGTNANTGRTGTSRSGSGTNQVVPQASDPFQTYYANPYKFGVTSTTGTGKSSTSGAFGTPLFGTTNSPTTATTGSSGTSNGTSFNTVGVRRAPAYTTTLGFAGPAAPAPSFLQTRLGAVVQSSPSLNNSNIQVVVNGGTVVLQGRVANENERRLAEGMLRLEPGVRDVRNELKIAAPQSGAAP